MVRNDEAYCTVFLQEKRIGRLQRRKGALWFQYADDAERDISISLPREQQDTPAFQIKADFFLGNLVPEGNTKKLLTKIFTSSGTSTFDILKEIGRDVAGALIFSKDDTLPPQNGVYRDVTTEIKNYIKTPHAYDCLLQAVPSRTSLAGVQDKLALVYTQGKMYVPVDFSATSHIIKPDIPEFLGTARNEHLCLAVVEHYNFPVCTHELLTIEGHDILLLERYDRKIENGRIIRFHQEDFCQAMGIPSYYKYQSASYDEYSEQGIVALATTANKVYLDISKELARRSTFFYFVGNFDAHAKNYSIVYVGTQCSLAPVCDTLCIPTDGPFDRIVSMDIGGKYNVDEINADSFLAMGFDLEYADLDAYAMDIATTLPDVVHDIAREHRSLYGNHKIYDAIIIECANICNNFKKRSQKVHDEFYTRTKKEYIQLCTENPLNIKKVPRWEQTEELVRIACKMCKNVPGVSPTTLVEYLRSDLRHIAEDYHG